MIESPASSLTETTRSSSFGGKCCWWATLLVVLLICTQQGWAQGDDVAWPALNLPDIKIEPSKSSNLPPNLQVMLFSTSLTLIPQFIVSCTAYIRVSIMLSYTKSALGSTQALSNQLMMGICLIMTTFIMYPVYERTNNTAVAPYLAGDISQAEFAEKFPKPVKEWMFYQTRVKDLERFYILGRYKGERPRSIDDVPFTYLFPAFIMSEVKTGFMIGFLIYLPFLVVDMVVAATLMSMGMFMISPSSISLPFKLLMFYTIDGWSFLLRGIINSFNRPPWMQ